MNSPAHNAPIANVSEAERAIANLEKIMDRLVDTVEEETARVRAGHLRDAVELDEAKVELARAYAAETDRVTAAKDIIAKSLPEALDRLAPAARCIPRIAANQSDGAGDRACRLRRHHPRRVGRACPQAGALDLWRFRPRQCAKQQGKPAAGGQPLALNRQCFGNLVLVAVAESSAKNFKQKY